MEGCIIAKGGGGREAERKGVHNVRPSAELG